MPVEVKRKPITSPIEIVEAWDGRIERDEKHVLGFKLVHDLVCIGIGGHYSQFSISVDELGELVHALDDLHGQMVNQCQ